MAALQNASSPRYLIADAKLYHEDKAPNLQKLGFITRIPNPLGAVAQVIAPARTWDTWHRLDATTRYQGMELCHYGRAQRWLVVHAQAALERAEATVTKARQREAEAIEKQRFHLQATRCPTPEVAQDALATLAKRWTSHQVESSPLIEHKRYAGQGRPPPSPPCRPLRGTARPASGLIRRRCDTPSTSRLAWYWAPISASAS
jgi:hypothetical protein